MIQKYFSVSGNEKEPGSSPQTAKAPAKHHLAMQRPEKYRLESIEEYSDPPSNKVVSRVLNPVMSDKLINLNKYIEAYQKQNKIAEPSTTQSNKSYINLYNKVPQQPE